MSVRWIGIIIFIGFLIWLGNAAISGSNSMDSLPGQINEMTGLGQMTSEQAFGLFTVPSPISGGISYFQSIWQTITMKSELFPENTPWQLVYIPTLGMIIAIIVFGLILYFISIFTRSI